MVAQSQLMQFINCSQELKEQMKEEFYKQKIQEAKDKKKLPQFNWAKLPEEVVEIIMNYKEKIEFVDGPCGSDYNCEGYMLEMWKKHNITGKSVCDYLFNEYKNENGEGLTRCFKPSNYLSKFLWCMINKKSFVEEKYHFRFNEKDIKNDNKFMEITKNKAPSLEELIVFRQKQKKEQSEKRKAKNKEKTKEKDEELKKLSTFKIGDLVYIHEKNYYAKRTAVMITGETKTQYRVEKIEWTYDGIRITDNDTIYINYGLSPDESKWIKSKYKNIGKKSNIQLLNCTADHRCPYDGELFYENYSYSMFD